MLNHHASATPPPIGLEMEQLPQEPGAIIACPPADGRGPWTFYVDGCNCGIGHTQKRHRTLSEAEWCAMQVRARKIHAS